MIGFPIVCHRRVVSDSGDAHPPIALLLNTVPLPPAVLRSATSNAHVHVGACLCTARTMLMVLN